MYPFTYTSSSTSKHCKSHDDITEPLLRAEIYSHHDTQNCNTTEPSSTSTTITPFNTIRTLLLLWIGILVGTLSAKMGLYILYELDPFFVLSYLKLNDSDENSDTSTFTRIMTFQNLFLTNVVAFFWSLCTVGMAYMVYKYVIIPFLHVTVVEKNPYTTSPISDNESICTDDIYQYETNHSNDDKDTNDDNEYSRQEMDQLMITIGTCVGFTITCIIYDVVSA